MNGSVRALTLAAGVIAACEVTAAQPVYTTMVVDNVTHASARVYWTIQTASTASAYVAYGLDKNNLNYTTAQKGSNSGTKRAATLGGLAPDSKIYFRPIMPDGTGAEYNTWSCISTTEVTGGLPLNGFQCDAAGEPPYFITKPHPGAEAVFPKSPEAFEIARPQPAVFLNVKADCSDLSTQLAAAVTQSATEAVQVSIPAGTVCKDVVLPLKQTPNWVIVRTAAPDLALPPEGGRIHPSYASSMVRFETTKPGTGVTRTALRTATTCNLASTTNCTQMNANTKWKFIGVEFTSQSSIPSGPVEAVRIKTAKPSTTGVIFETETPHGFEQNQLVRVIGVTGLGGSFANGERDLTVLLGPTLFRIDYGGTITGSPTTGGWVIPAAAHAITSVQTDSRNCGGAVELGFAPGKHGLLTGEVAQIAGVEGVAGVNGSRVVTVINHDNVCLNNTYGSGEYKAGTGFMSVDPSLWFTLVRLYPDASDIVFDRCYIHGRGFPDRVYIGAAMHGQRVAIINSYIDNITAWGGINPVDNSTVIHAKSFNNRTSIAIDFSVGKQHLYENNHIEGAGILLFGQDTPSTYPTPSDIIIRRNYIHSPKKYMAGSKESDGRHYPHRHCLELKRGERLLMDGNVCDGGWSDEVPIGSMLTMTPRAGTDNATSLNYVRDIHITNNTFKNGAAGLAVAGGETWGVTEPPATTRVAIVNNIITDLNWWENRSNPSQRTRVGKISSPTGGTIFHMPHSMHGVVIQHNLVFNNVGSGPILFHFSSTRSSGIRIRDNLLVSNKGPVYAGFYYERGSKPIKPEIPGSPAAALFAGWAHNMSSPEADPYSEFTNNYIVRGIKTTGSASTDAACYTDSSSSCNYTQTECTDHYGTGPNFKPVCVADAGKATAVQRFDAVQFRAWKERNFRLRGGPTDTTSSPFVSGRVRTTDGKNAGPDMNMLEAAQGKINAFRVLLNSGRTIEFAYTAPDAQTCTVDLSATSTFEAPRRAGDGGGTAARVVRFSELDSNRLYYYRLFCGSEWRQGTVVAGDNQ